MKAAWLALLALALSASAKAAHRSATAVRQFKAEHPCPATGQAKGPCPGFVVDHREPLCAGGADAPHNMQWQTAEDAKAKDRTERAQCRRR